jgi:hypothetical protein
VRGAWRDLFIVRMPGRPSLFAPLNRRALTGVGRVGASNRIGAILMQKRILLACLMAWVCWMASVLAGETLERPSPLAEPRLNEQLRALRQMSASDDKRQRALDLTTSSYLSSLQVKAIATALDEDADRLDFALAAYPRTVDPENFYDVYDAFKTFSKVMRLHDRLLEQRRSPAPPPPRRAVSKTEMTDILRVLGNEGLDSTRMKTARQIVGSRSDFTARQIQQILALFPFESSKLELAKFAFDHVQDPANYFLVNEVFSFSSSKDELARFTQARQVPTKQR